MIAHIGVIPLEEILPAITGASSGLLALRGWNAMRKRLRSDPH
jgi:hypothetical protein